MLVSKDSSAKLPLRVAFWVSAVNCGKADHFSQLGFRPVTFKNYTEREKESIWKVESINYHLNVD